MLQVSWFFFVSFWLGSISNEVRVLIDVNLFFLVDACTPMMSLLNLQPEDTTTYLVDACAGLIGTSQINRYPCVLYANSNCLVWLADTDISLFSKSTFFNLANFAEDNLGATKITFVLSANHTQKRQYRDMFEVIDAVKLHTS
jgi:hypothetical protein